MRALQSFSSDATLILLRISDKTRRNVTGLTNDTDYLLPYWLNYLGGEENFNKSQCLCAGANNWVPTQQAMNGGLMNQWAQVDDPQSWGYFKRQDIAYHYALADAYTVGDAYHVRSLTFPVHFRNTDALLQASITSNTDPNRWFWQVRDFPCAINILPVSFPRICS
jgi:phospholipase C